MATVQLTEVARHFMTQSDKGASQAIDAQNNNLTDKVEPVILHKALRAAAGASGGEAYAPVPAQTANVNREVTAAELIKELFSQGVAEGKPLEQIVRDVLKEAQERKAVQQHPEATEKMVRASTDNNPAQTLNNDVAAAVTRPKNG